MNNIFKSIAIAIISASPALAHAEAQIINESSSNITVLRTFPSGVNIAFRGQLSWNAVVISPELCETANSTDTPFAEESLTLDCTKALQDALREQMPQLSAPVAGQFLVPATTELVHSNESTSKTLVVKNFSCSLQEIQTASRESALSSATGIGFFFAETQSTVKPSDLALASRAVSRSGERLAIHRFVAPAFCTSGSRSSALRATYAFRPFMEFVGENETIYRSWDNVSADYVISESSVRAFDRSSQILQ